MFFKANQPHFRLINANVEQKLKCNAKLHVLHKLSDPLCPTENVLDGHHVPDGKIIVDVTMINHYVLVVKIY